MISGRLRPFSNDFTGEELLPRSIATSHDKGAYRGTPNHLKIGCAKIWIFQLPSTQENYLLVEIFSSWYKNLRSTIAKTFWTDEFKTKKNFRSKCILVSVGRGNPKSYYISLKGINFQLDKSLYAYIVVFRELIN